MEGTGKVKMPGDAAVGLCSGRRLLPGRYLATALALILLTLPCGRLARSHETAPDQPPTLGVTEHQGRRIPLDLTFRDETGKPVRLGELVTGPTIIMPVYYGCTNVCTYQQARMAGALRKLERKPIEGYRVLSVSFDETEGPELAARSKKIYLTAMGGGFPPDGWRFLTGDGANISRLTDALGFSFRRKGNDFIHPVVTVVITGDGVIVRYLYGITVLPKDLALALTEAKSGVTGASVRKLMEFCFSYDPAGKGYAFNLLRVSATIVILCAGGFLAFLLLAGRKRKNISAEQK